MTKDQDTNSAQDFQVLKAMLDAKPGVWTMLGVFFAAIALPLGAMSLWVQSEFRDVHGEIGGLQGRSVIYDLRSNRSKPRWMRS